MSEMILQIGDSGSIELKAKMKKFTTEGFVFGAILHLMFVGLYWSSVYMSHEEPPQRTIRIMKYSELGPPPSISGANQVVAPSVSIANPQSRPSMGTPVPVPDAEVSPEQVFATQAELSQNVGAVDEGGLGDGSTVIEQDIVIDDNEPPPDFVPFEKEPQIVKQSDPVYPEIARRAGVEGRVWVKMWVDKDGKVRDVKILKTDSEIFNEATITACRQFKFTPALMKNGPVAVWVAMDFVFKLK
jgi:periplasmic protein TonB